MYHDVNAWNTCTMRCVYVDHMYLELTVWTAWTVGCLNDAWAPCTMTRVHRPHVPELTSGAAGLICHSFCTDCMYREVGWGSLCSMKWVNAKQVRYREWAKIHFLILCYEFKKNLDIDKLLILKPHKVTMIMQLFFENSLPWISLAPWL